MIPGFYEVCNKIHKVPWLPDLGVGTFGESIVSDGFPAEFIGSEATAKIKLPVFAAVAKQNPPDGFTQFVGE